MVFSVKENSLLYRLPILLLVLLVLNACANVVDNYQKGKQIISALGITDNHRVNRSSHWVVKLDSSFYVATPVMPNVDAAEKIARTIKTVMTGYFAHVQGGEHAESMSYAHDTAKQFNVDYLVYPRILVWQDSLGTWTEIRDAMREMNSEELEKNFARDRAMLQLSLIEVTSGRLIDIASIESLSGLLTLYDNNPEKMMATALHEYANSLRP